MAMLAALIPAVLSAVGTVGGAAAAGTAGATAAGLGGLTAAQLGTIGGTLGSTIGMAATSGMKKGETPPMQLSGPPALPPSMGQMAQSSGQGGGIPSIDQFIVPTTSFDGGGQGEMTITELMKLLAQRRP